MEPKELKTTSSVSKTANERVMVSTHFFYPSNRMNLFAHSELDNPCALGEPQMGFDNRPLQCSLQSNTCDISHWCHFGANQATTVCCPGKGTQTQQPFLPFQQSKVRQSVSSR